MSLVHPNPRASPRLFSLLVPLQSPLSATPPPSSPSDASQLHPSSPRETSEAPSDPSHPCDATSFPHLAARLPLPSSSFDVHGDDYEKSGVESDGNLNGRRVIRDPVYNLWKCAFTQTFLPLSLLTAVLSRCTSPRPPEPILSSVPPSLEPPTPLYYIHKTPDLTRESGPGPSPSRPLRRYMRSPCLPSFLPPSSRPWLLRWIPRAIQAQLLRPTKPIVISSPAGQQYAFSFATDTRPIALYRKILALQDHRLALQPLLIDALDCIWSLSDFEMILSALCLHATVRLARAEEGVASHTSKGIDVIGLLHEHLRWFRSGVAIWNELRTSSDFDTIPSNLTRAVRLLNVSSIDDNGSVVRAALFGADRDPFVAACRPCDPAALTIRSTHDSAMPVSRPVRSRHFACLPDSAPTAASNTTATFLLDWATARSTECLETLHNAPLGGDDTRLFPNNQHSFPEADEVVSAKLPAEAAVRCHLFGIAVCISTLASLLVERRVIEPATDATSSDRYEPAIADGVNAPSAIRNSTMIPTVRLAGQAAAGFSRGCALSADVVRDLDNLDRAGPASQETTEASVRAPASPVMDAGATTMVELKHVIHTIVAKLEAESLCEHPSLCAGSFRRGLPLAQHSK
ncbi:hypothetical protein GQ607_016831 [Colletotrichum asianum]|uniref:Uncharacterized protein n=1 Tax=Colletotrichum asianum TaxID=702518 RepID=A0A8H3ZH86_9PEZI|nr:hypothetical protein GQ607_016831 [Colletotrichum asianum]